MNESPGYGTKGCRYSVVQYVVLRVHVRYLAWWLSWLERRPVTAEVVGSNPIRVAVFITEYFL